MIESIRRIGKVKSPLGLGLGLVPVVVLVLGLGPVEGELITC